MQSRKANFAKRRSVRSQFISDDYRRNKALAAKEFAEKAQCRRLVAPGLNKYFQNLALAVNGAPHVHLLSRERDHNFIKMPPGGIGMSGRRPVIKGYFVVCG
jgi:hypothetical protein